MSRPLLTALGALLVITGPGSPAFAAVYHVDAVNGDDATGDGSEALPFQTLSHVRPLLAGGDTVILYDGNYGAVEELVSGAPPADLFTDWVTYQAAEGSNPQIEYIRFGNYGTMGPQDQTGGFDAYLRFEGLHVLDGLQSYGARHWALVDCLVERYGPWTGSVDNIEKTAISWRCGTDILIQDCEVTNTGTAIGGRGHDVRIIGNHIHDGTHDGIRVTGYWNSLVEGNVIHGFDDGVTDAEADWSRHCDLIHIFIPGPGYDGWQNHNVIFRNNILYDAEAQIVQFNNYGGNRNEMIVFENNVFGPGHAPMFNNADGCDGLVFRHNTIVYAPDGRQFNRWHCDNYLLRISGSSTDVEIYNNILGSTGIDSGADVNVFDWNLVQLLGNPAGVDDSRAYGRFTLIGADPRFVDPENMDYRFLADSPAIHAGTRDFAPDPLYEWDYEGTPRDNRPDMGVYEYPELSPPPEDPLPDYPGTKHVFVDDFEDGHYNDIDPWLEGPDQQGLSWHQPDLPKKFYVTNSSLLDRNCLLEPIGTSGVGRVAWIFSDQGADWTDYEFEFEAWNSYLYSGGGPLLLAQNEQNTYWLDISRSNGDLVRFMTDEGGTPTETLLASEPAIELPHYGARLYHLNIVHDPEGITIEVDADADGTVELSYTDTDPLALQRFATGGVGFHSDTEDVYHRITYDNVAVAVGGFPEEGPEIQTWEILENHGTAGEVAVTVLDNHIASTLDRIGRVRVTFTGPVAPATVDAGVVSVLGQLSSPLPGIVADVSLNPDGTQMTVDFDPRLPNLDRYVLTVSDTVTGTDGLPLGGNRDRVLSVLTGDVTASGRVTAGDALLIRDKVGSSLGPQNARYDVDGSGVITALDMLTVRAFQGQSLE